MDSDGLIPFSTVLDQVDAAWMLENTERLLQAERGQCFRHYRQAAIVAENLLRDAGLDRVERIVVPADGKTTHLDRTMPLAWDATRGVLTVKKSPVAFEDPVVASYERHPFHLVKGSAATPSGGVLTRLISEQQLFGGVDAAGAMVLLESDALPPAATIRALCDAGALGFVCDYLVGRRDTPDAMCWFTVCTEGANWHVQAQDRPWIGFSVTPRIGEQLRTAVRRGEVLVHVESDGRRYEGELDIVTGVIPGEEEREVWLMAHLYEPMADDNSAGVVGAVEIARVLRRLMSGGKLARPRFTLRLVFAMEMYGFAAYAARRGVPLRDRVLGAHNLDAVPVKPVAAMNLAPPGAPFFGDYLFEQLLEEYQDGKHPLQISIETRPCYGDDLFLNDPMMDLPTVWLIGRFDWWHNSAQEMSVLDPKVLTQHIAFCGTWIIRMLNLRETCRGDVMRTALKLARKHIEAEAARSLKLLESADGDREHIRKNAATGMRWRLEREEARLRDFERAWDVADLQPELDALGKFWGATAVELARHLRPIAESDAKPDPVRDAWAASIVPRRTAPWGPHDQANVPMEKRIQLPGSVIYGPLAHVLARADGKRTLKELIEHAEWAYGRTIPTGEIRKYISAIEHLAEYGHIGVTHSEAIQKSEIVRALGEAGLREGDLILVHGSLSAFGHIEGGAETVIDAFLEALGPRGTLLMPTFTQSAIYSEGEWIVSKQHRPFDVTKAEVWVGRTSAAFCKRAGAVRSAHPTHSVAGCGPLARDCLDGHRETDSPTGRRSPFGKLVDHKGKMVWFGADLASTTFFHFLEDEAGLPYLKSALCRVRRPNGTVESVLVPRWLPGHREFYKAPGEATKMYRRLTELGLGIRVAPLGLGKIKVIEASQMYELGMAALKSDPWLMLCDDPECLFCRTYNRRT